MEDGTDDTELLLPKQHSKCHAFCGFWKIITYLGIIIGNVIHHGPPKGNPNLHSLLMFFALEIQNLYSPLLVYEYKFYSLKTIKTAILSI